MLIGVRDEGDDDVGIVGVVNVVGIESIVGVLSVVSFQTKKSSNLSNFRFLGTRDSHGSLLEMLSHLKISRYVATLQKKIYKLFGNIFQVI